MNLYNTPGLHYVSHVSNLKVNDGQPLPLFEPVVSEGRSSINTLEGWNILANNANRKAFESVFGRMPVDTAELSAWEASNFTEDFQ